MAKQKPIPWFKQLKRLAHRYIHCEKVLDHAGLIPEYSAYYACHKRFVGAADFTGVKWTMKYFNKSNYGIVFRIEASFMKNPTRWMMALKEARKIGKRCGLNWRWGARFKDDFHKATVMFDDKGVEIEFADKAKAIVYCRRHKIKEIARRKLELSYDEMIRKVELDRKLSREVTDAIFGGPKRRKKGK